MRLTAGVFIDVVLQGREAHSDASKESDSSRFRVSYVTQSDQRSDGRTAAVGLVMALSGFI